MSLLRTALIAFCALSSCKEKPASVTPQEVRVGPIRSPGLTQAQLDRIKKLQAVFAEVDSMPLEKWVDDFSRDLHPDRELAIYEGMAEAYETYCAGRTLTLAAKQDVYSVVLVRSGVSDDEVLARVHLKALSSDDVIEILRGYRVPPAPVTVTDAPP